MEKERQNQKLEQKKSNWNIKPYLAMGLVTLIVIVCGITYFFIILRYDGLSNSWDRVQRVIQPILFGIVFSYLMNPIVKKTEHLLGKLMGGKIKNSNNEKKLFRGVGITVALIAAIVAVGILLKLVIPDLYQSIEGLVISLPSQASNTIDWIKERTTGDGSLAKYAEQFVISATDYMENWLKNNLLPQSRIILTQLTSGVLSVVKALFNILIGLIISVYLLSEKEIFLAQGKKILYALFPAKMGNVIITTVRKSHEIFIGFISGKIIDSIIIGILCFIILSIVSMPYALLVSVIVGVTNVIPFFGPYIGAIPSFLLILLVDPMKSIYFLIIILILQQIDGNIIGPHILGDSTGLSAFWVVFAILIGGGLFGVLGMLIGVPVFAIIYYITGKLICYCLRRRKLPEETKEYEGVKKIDFQKNKLVK
ncbi:MAG: AI-2E family transporter [Lachnospiraceae bacterium]